MATAEELQLLSRIASLTLAQRQAADPMRLWQPLVVHQPFIQSVLHPEQPGGHWENWFVGANRVGKTSVGAFCGATLARAGLPEPHASYSTLSDGTRLDVRDRATAGWVLGLDSNTNRDIIQPRYFDNGYVKPGMPEPFIPEREIAKWEQDNQILKLRNGSFIGWKSGEQDAIKVTGGAIDWLHGDEPPKKAHYDELLIRIGAGRRFRKFFTATILPPQGHAETISWVYQEILEPIVQGQVRDVGLFQASIYDNPYLPGEEILQLESRYPLGSLSRRIRLNGELLPGIAGAVAYGNFARSVHVRVLPPLSHFRPLCWTWDFNVSPFCTSLWQVHPDQLYCYDEMVLEEGNIDAMLDEFERRYPRHPHEVWIYGDANGGNRSHTTAGKPKSSYDLILSRLQRYPSPVKMHVPAANPMEIDRINAVNAAFRDAQGASHVVISPTCTGMIRDFEQVLMDPRGGIKKTYNHRDPYSELTHLSDGAGYLIIAERPVRQQRGGPGRVSVKSAAYGVGSGR